MVARLSVVFFGVLLIGCAGPGTGKRFLGLSAEVQQLQERQVPSGKTRLIFYVPGSEFASSINTRGVIYLEVSGKRVFNNLGLARYDSVLLEAGPTQLKVGRDDDFGSCSQSYFLPPGEVVFVRAKKRNTVMRIGAQVLFGVLGQVAESEAASKRDECGGPWMTEVVTIDEALKDFSVKK